MKIQQYHAGLIQETTNIWSLNSVASPRSSATGYRMNVYCIHIHFNSFAYEYKGWAKSNGLVELVKPILDLPLRTFNFLYVAYYGLKNQYTPARRTKKKLLTVYIFRDNRRIGCATPPLTSTESLSQESKYINKVLRNKNQLQLEFS